MFLQFYKDMAEEGNRNILNGFVVFFVASLFFHGYVYSIVKADDIAKRREDPLFQVSFEEQQAVESTEIIVGDGEQHTLDLVFSNDDLRSSHMLAMVAITVDYDETSGEVGDSCDVVNADIPPTGFMAEWSDERNILAGNADDCSQINLVVHVYPGYDGVEYLENNQLSPDIEAAWSDSSYGEGTLSIQLEVDATQPLGAGVLPTANDENERLLIEWTVTWFDVSVELIGTA
ncbi:MAG: hypothetical protein VXY10_03500 [Candidatus Thermoplasmatota archaeon]|nr:hypothetical protein [Candidatus Thermoplasmatota archaeon]MEC8680482.1 hypothetical protein [Candidatus Thermoplasmatota archaeon]